MSAAPGPTAFALFWRHLSAARPGGAADLEHKVLYARGFGPTNESLAAYLNIFDSGFTKYDENQLELFGGGMENLVDTEIHQVRQRDGDRLGLAPFERERLGRSHGQSPPADGAVSVAHTIGRPFEQAHSCCSIKLGSEFGQKLTSSFAA